MESVLMTVLLSQTWNGKCTNEFDKEVKPWQANLHTNKRESFSTSLPNSSQESAPIGTYDIPFDLYCHVEQTRGMRFPEFFPFLEKTQATTGLYSSFLYIIIWLFIESARFP